MFFYVAKVAWFLLQPSSLIAVCILAGLLMSFTARGLVWGRRLAVLGAIGLIIGGLSPLANWLVLPLENQIARADLDKAGQIAGIIILGGSENGRVAGARGAITLNEAGERVVEAAVLARRFPAAKILFSGGAAKVLREEKSGAPSVKEFLVAIGVAKSRIILEAKSRNTYENAVFSKASAKPRKGERWVLVTSAFHMPRALGCFRKAGFDVLPWPVDYRTKGMSDLTRPFNSVSKGLRRLDIVSKEWIGLVIYYLTGRTGNLLEK